MHAEFSSILYINYKFPNDQWSKINESGWEYLGLSSEFLARKDLYVESDELYRKGFVSLYGQASIEEDVNMYVFAVIQRRSSMTAAAVRHTRVKQKLEILTRFYEGISRDLPPSGRFEFLIRLKDITDPLMDVPQSPLYIAVR